jgi:hypothetical protein
MLPEMMPRFLSHQAAAATRDVDLLDVLSELVDGHADTVELLIGDPPRDVELLAHCEYLRALQRLGHATLAREGDRSLGARFALAAADAGNTSLTRPWTAALAMLRALARAVRASSPQVIDQSWPWFP